MTLLETVYRHLKRNQLTHSAEHFSKEYLNKSRSWYAVQTHLHRDFSLSAAIECLRHIRTAQRSLTATTDTQQLNLAELEQLLAQYLKHHHAVAEIAL
jgi:hypothetical protein